MLSVDSQIASELKAIGMGQEDFAQHCGIDRSIIGAALRGTKPLSNERALQAWSVILELRELKQRAGDFPIDFSDFPAIRAMLTKLRQEKEDPPRLTADDWALISLVQTMDVEGIGPNLGLTLAEVTDRMEEIIERLSFTAYEMRKTNEEARALTQIRNEETEKLRNRRRA